MAMYSCVETKLHFFVRWAERSRLWREAADAGHANINHDDSYVDATLGIEPNTNNTPFQSSTQHTNRLRNDSRRRGRLFLYDYTFVRKGHLGKYDGWTELI